jgi:hypothetical protein
MITDELAPLLLTARAQRMRRLEQLLATRPAAVLNFATLRYALGVSPATLKRDLQFMRERLAAPIAYDRWANGYHLAAPWQLLRAATTTTTNHRRGTMTDTRHCGSCGLPIHPSETGLRHFGFHTSHAPARCVELLQAEIAGLRTQKDAAYLERNQVVAALAKCFPSGVARTAIEGWSPEWHPCVYIDLPTGQASWHFHETRHAHLFAGLPPYSKPWDGHDTPEKYRRLEQLQPAPTFAWAWVPSAAWREWVISRDAQLCAAARKVGLDVVELVRRDAKPVTTESKGPAA